MPDKIDPKQQWHLIVGAALVVIALTADNLDLGGNPGFGWKQGVVLGLGILIGLLGKHGGKFKNKIFSEIEKEDFNAKDQQDR